MHEIDSPGSEAGKFIDENPELNRPGTLLWAKWLNNLQAECMSILAARGIAPDETKDDQILKAILEMVSGADMIVRFTTTDNIVLNGNAVQPGGDWAAPIPDGTLVLVRSQFIPQDNGPYVVNATGDWSRLNTFDSSEEIIPGKTIKVTEGVTLADSIWMLKTDAPIVLNSTPLIFERKDAASGVKYFASGTTLPASNIGPIWHDDYNSIMTWKAFTANGAAYTGYASVLVGSLLLDAQPTPRTGYVKNGTSNLNRATYAALRGWAMHNGIMVASGVWAAGQIAVCDNVDGTTFKIYDVRGEFPRFWDDSRGIDSGRVFGSGQTQDVGPHPHTVTSPATASGSGSTNPGGVFKGSSGDAGNYGSVSVTSQNNTGTETRPRNVAFAGMVKF